MAFPTFDGFSLQDSNYIIQDIVYRTIPSRTLDVQKIARRTGSKLLASDFDTRSISMSGYILGSTISDLRDKIDNLHNNVTRKADGVLQMEESRTASALVSNLSIADSHYNQTMVPFEIEFLLTDPFFYGPQNSVSWSVGAGEFSLTDTLTISGSMFAEPLISYTAAAGAGQTTTSGILVTYVDTGEVITWSGTGATTTLADGDTVQFDYINHKILEGTAEQTLEGVFSRWEPGSRGITITFSGTSDQGGTLSFAYQPRYL